MSSYVIAAPEALATASADLTGLGETIRAANAAAATSTTGLAAAAGDEVSAAIAGLFGNFGQEFQAPSAHSAVSRPVRAGVELRGGSVCIRRGRQHLTAADRGARHSGRDQCSD